MVTSLTSPCTRARAANAVARSARAVAAVKHRMGLIDELYPTSRDDAPNLTTLDCAVRGKHRNQRYMLARMPESVGEPRLAVLVYAIHDKAAEEGCAAFVGHAVAVTVSVALDKADVPLPALFATAPPGRGAATSMPTSRPAPARWAIRSMPSTSTGCSRRRSSAKGVEAYEAQRYQEALDIYGSASKTPAGDQLRVYNGLYRASWSLGRRDEAMRIPVPPAPRRSTIACRCCAPTT